MWYGTRAAAAGQMHGIAVPMVCMAGNLCSVAAPAGASPAVVHVLGDRSVDALGQVEEERLVHRYLQAIAARRGL